MQLLVLGDDVLLFSEPRQELYALNASAAEIWRLLEQGHDAAAVARELRGRFHLRAEEATSFVMSALADWAAKGLLAGTEGPALASPPPGWQPRSRLPAFPDPPPPVIAEYDYHLLTSRIRMRFTADAQAELVHPILRHLDVPVAGDDVVFDIVALAGRIVVYRDRVPVAACRTLDRLVPKVYAAVWMAALQAHDFLLNIHAGVVATGDGCVLLPALPGSGKSTLTAALVHAGFTFYSDEVALLDAATLRVAPFFQAFCIKQSGIAAVAEFYPAASTLPLHWRGDGKRVAYLPPSRAHLPAATARGDVRLLVFPTYAAGQAATCEALPKSAALARLLGQCTILNRRLDTALVRELVAWITRIPCFDLRYGTTAEAVDAVRRIVVAMPAREAGGR